ncbi:PREDICTED: uncharacterized protein LOC109478841 [Branchiostoma belcheri]|uniref:Netrin receptor UNC5 n=1 Tax=Branchiostoma belcheri TaxID=7741 RepID=A0A6P4ZZ25_BRABE|nr:PREDICTED: uncharacterized protein LOC109478841 [Branchiostoma belcheri]
MKTKRQQMPGVRVKSENSVTPAELEDCKRNVHGVHEPSSRQPLPKRVEVVTSKGTISPDEQEIAPREHYKEFSASHKEDNRRKVQETFIHKADNLKLNPVHDDMMSQRQCSASGPPNLSKVADNAYGSNESSGYDSMVSPRASPDIKRSEKDTKTRMSHEDTTANNGRQKDLCLFEKLRTDYVYSKLREDKLPLASDRLQTNYSSTNFAAGVFDHTGGHLSVPRHDVNLFIPPGAIEVGQLQTIHIFVPPSMNHGKPAPIVHCGPTGTTFLDHVILTFPVNPSYDKDDIVPKFTNTEVGSAEEWHPLLQDDDGASMVENGKCTLFLAHFTGYGAEAKKEASPRQMSPRSDPPRDSHLLTASQAFLHQQEELQPTDRSRPILPIDVRHQMCVLLDVENPEGKDWRMMAEKIGLDSAIIRWIEARSRFKSPTYKLLDFWESRNVSGGAVALWRLSNLCEEIGRPDVAQLVNSVSGDVMGDGNEGRGGSMSLQVTPNSSCATLNYSGFSESCVEDSDSETYRSFDSQVRRGVSWSAPIKREVMQSPDSGYEYGDLMSVSSQSTQNGSQSTLNQLQSLHLPESVSKKSPVLGPLKGLTVTDL